MRRMQQCILDNGGEMRIRETGAPLYRLKVTLQGVRPPIWRRFLVPGDIKLNRLHDSLQAVMGWTNSHLHQFDIRGERYGIPDREFGDEITNENKIALCEVLSRPKDRLIYQYDFGDDWIHDVVLEAVLPAGEKGQYPMIEAGKRACPIEDCGGCYGYMEMLEALKDSKHPEHENMVEWVGGSFDSEAFNVIQANIAIHGGWVKNKE
jgi:hypothetical protein